MNHLVEQQCKGTFRSYKTFRASGAVVLHTIQEFQEWDFSDNHVLTISTYRQQRRSVQVETDQWNITFSNKRYYLQLTQPAMRLEVISVNHTGLVINDSARGEKIFFARFPIWENLIRNRLPVF